MPVLPLVGSMMHRVRAEQAARSAASIIATPMRSLTLPAGLNDSNFVRIVGPGALTDP